MSKDKPSIRENRRKPMMTLKEKRTARKAKRHMFADIGEVAR